MQDWRNVVHLRTDNDVKDVVKMACGIILTRAEYLASFATNPAVLCEDCRVYSDQIAKAADPRNKD